mgnify:CR=1 FL=1
MTIMGRCPKPCLRDESLKNLFITSCEGCRTESQLTASYNTILVCTSQRQSKWQTSGRTVHEESYTYPIDCHQRFSGLGANTPFLAFNFLSYSNASLGVIDLPFSTYFCGSGVQSNMIRTTLRL